MYIIFFVAENAININLFKEIKRKTILSNKKLCISNDNVAFFS